jgi:signal transduction histidine kinase
MYIIDIISITRDNCKPKSMLVVFYPILCYNLDVRYIFQKPSSLGLKKKSLLADMKIKNYKKNIIILISILLIAGFVSTSFISYFVARSSLKKEILVNLPLTSDNVYSEVQRDLLSPILISSVMANDIFLRKWVLAGEKNPEEMIQYLKGVKDSYKAFTSFFVSDKTRIYYQTKGVLKKINASSVRDIWYFRLRKSKVEYELNIDVDMANHDTITIFINHKVFDFNGNFIGATGLGLKNKSVQDLITEYHKKYNRNIYFVTPAGKIILHCPLCHIKEYDINKNQELSLIFNGIRHNGKTRAEYKKDGKTVFLNARYIKELGWYLMVEQSSELTNLSIFKTLILNLIFCGVVTLLVIIIVSLIVNRHHKKLKSMIKTELDLININNGQKLKIEKQNLELFEKNKKLTELNTFKDKLFAVIAHDLRSPIGNIHYLLEHIADDLSSQLSNKKMHDFARSLKDAAGSTYALLENLLGWANIQFSKVEYQPTIFSVDELLQESIPLHKYAMEQKNISVAVNCGNDIKAFADINIVKTIIRNLISNAVKFTPENGKISIDTEIQDDKVVISVRDNGVGIEKDRISKLFGFNNISTRGTKGESGVGLGLSLSRDLARANKGDIQVESSLGKGSIFTLIVQTAKAR